MARAPQDGTSSRMCFTASYVGPIFQKFSLPKMLSPPNAPTTSAPPLPAAVLNRGASGEGEEDAHHERTDDAKDADEHDIMNLT